MLSLNSEDFWKVLLKKVEQLEDSYHDDRHNNTATNCRTVSLVRCFIFSYSCTFI